jgi:fructokinase
MTTSSRLALFGEVLFDIFPTGEKILGGAPFNVAWNLQALGDAPLLISRVGQDRFGEDILQAMRTWGMQTAGVQVDPNHPTGQVQVEFIDNQPHYRIVPDCAYDFIYAEETPELYPGAILYHGTLGIRNEVARKALKHLYCSATPSLFLDVNLRAPWWRQEEVAHWLSAARWVKLNHDELGALGFQEEEPAAALEELQSCFNMEQIILTRGEQGSIVRTSTGEVHQMPAEPTSHFVDTVGAGDAFSAVYLHGLLAGWSLPQTLDAAQRFAGMVIGLRGATTMDQDFYGEFLATY